MNSTSKLIVGNWKMHGTLKETRKQLFSLTEQVGTVPGMVEIVMCPPFTALSTAKQALEGSRIKLGAQNCYLGREGAFTGEISPAMLVDLGCEYVILGHSERRQYFGETDALVTRKLRSALDNALKPIVCIGETEAERLNDATESVLLRQLAESLASIDAADAANVTIAYEPVWAIGTGNTATPNQAQQVHHFIRAELRKEIWHAC